MKNLLIGSVLIGLTACGSGDSEDDNGGATKLSLNGIYVSDGGDSFVVDVNMGLFSVDEEEAYLEDIGEFIVESDSFRYVDEWSESNIYYSEVMTFEVISPSEATLHYRETAHNSETGDLIYDESESETLTRQATSLPLSSLPSFVNSKVDDSVNWTIENDGIITAHLPYCNVASGQLVENDFYYTVSLEVVGCAEDYAMFEGVYEGYAYTATFADGDRFFIGAFKQDFDTYIWDIVSK